MDWSDILALAFGILNYFVLIRFLMKAGTLGDKAGSLDSLVPRLSSVIMSPKALDRDIRFTIVTMRSL